MTEDRFRTNNLDLLRLLAAFQVLLLHALEHLKVGVDPLARAFLNFFPGVPIFFFISGFLISRSYEMNPRLREYATNRCLRIFPGLWVCVVLTALVIAWTGYFDAHRVGFLELMPWLLAQATFVQFFNPEYLRDFGIGVANGSLWTISVELQFYLLMPLLALGLKHLERYGRVGRWLLALSLLMLIVVNRAYVYSASQYSEHLVHKLLGVSFLPWLYMFVAGVLAQRNFALLCSVLAGKFAWALSAYVLAMSLGLYFGVAAGNAIGPVLFAFLVALIFSAAYTRPSLGRSLLRGNDVSYGVYIYHMPIINILVFYGYDGRFLPFVIAMIATGILAFLSWVLVEKRALRAKKHPMNPVQAVGKAW